jgi:putative SOS response-associated peptidase YedK
MPRSMPVILSKDVETKWLNPDMEPKQALELLAQDIPADKMEAYPVSMKVNRKSQQTRLRNGEKTGDNTEAAKNREHENALVTCKHRV